MSQIIHCCMLLFIVLVLAEIRNVLLTSDPRHPERITIWDEEQPPPSEKDYTPTYKL